MNNQARDAAMFQMMIRTGMIQLWEDEKEVRVEICSNLGSSGGLFKRAIPDDSAIPRATVADALAALPESLPAPKRFIGFSGSYYTREDILMAVYATITALGLDAKE